MPAIAEPLGRFLSSLGKGYLHLLRLKLQHLDIDRNYYVLVLIESRQGVINQQDLACMLDTDKVSIVRMVDYLAEKGYIIRERQTGDKRKQNLLLTEKALQALPEIKQSFAEVNQIALTGLSNARISELTETLEKIKYNLTANIRKI